MKYILSTPHASTRFIELEMIIDHAADAGEGNDILVQLPSWRPGRYELGNFAKNIQKFTVTDKKGNALNFRKISKDQWHVKCNGAEEIHIHYNYHAAQLDAGACWLDEEQLYFNPVHCFLYVPDRMNEEHVVELNTGFKQIATSLKQSGSKLIAKDYHELVDSPVIASDSMQHQTYETGKTQFHIWMQGQAKPDWNRIITDFKKFTEEQLGTMKEFPFREYHFLIQVLPVKFYHGVEHLSSTVLALGPGYKLIDEEVYTDFIGVASHELFHAWNIKSIRPAEMMPYNYTKENYSRLGFVAEGVTTYYGDLFLLRCGVYSVKQYFAELNVRLQKHFDNYGRFNLSVADASFDTWLDGYTPGIPDRKTSIYDEGCLTALMTDLLIRRHTGNNKSLDDVLQSLYIDFAKRHHGYSEEDYKRVVENTAGKPLQDLFSNYIYGTLDYKPLLDDLLETVGCGLVISPAKNLNESLFGFKAVIENGLTKISAIAPASPAYHAGLSRQDEIIAVNETRVENNLHDLIRYHQSAEKITLHIFSSQKKLKTLELKPDGKTYYNQYKIEQLSKINADQKKSFSAWTHVDR